MDPVTRNRSSHHETTLPEPPKDAKPKTVYSLDALKFTPEPLPKSQAPKAKSAPLSRGAQSLADKHAPKLDISRMRAGDAEKARAALAAAGVETKPARSPLEQPMKMASEKQAPLPDPLPAACTPRFSVEVRRYAPFDEFGGGFEGDGAARKPTADPKASSRVTGRVSVDLKDGTYRSKMEQGSTRLGPFSRTGTPEGNASAARTRDGGAAVRMHSEGSNGLMFGAAPAIDSDLDAKLVVENGKLKVSGKLEGDDFPNAEVIVRDAKGKGVVVGSFETPHGKNGAFTRLNGHGEHDLVEFEQSIPLNEDCSFRGK